VLATGQQECLEQTKPALLTSRGTGALVGK